MNARQGAARDVEGESKNAADPMAAAERTAASQQQKGPSFVAAQNRTAVLQAEELAVVQQASEDEIQIDDDI